MAESRRITAAVRHADTSATWELVRLREKSTTGLRVVRAFKPAGDICTHMPEEVLFETEQRMSRNDVAAYLRTVAEKLESGGDISLSAGDQSVTLAPPAEPTFEVKAERETPSGGGSGELSIELELEWDEQRSGSDGTDDSLSIS